MEPTSSASTSAPRVETGAVKAARYLFAALLAVNLIRAITQSVTPGEALNFNRYIGPAWAEALSRFDVNNHVLNTLLVRISTARFHMTELSLRLPSLFAGILYLVAVYRLARRWFGSGFVFASFCAVLTLNPLVVDALSEARGYGMALAAWMWALHLILESTQSLSPKKLNLAAVCLGLSVVASLAFAAPACALLAVAILWFKDSRESGRRRLFLSEIFLLTLFVLLTIPVNRAQWLTLGVGATSLRQSLNELTAISLGTSSSVAAAVARVAVGIAALAGLAAAWRYWRRPDSAILAITGAVLPSTIVLLLFAHRYLHTPFPQQGSIYFIPLMTVLVSAALFNRHTKAAHFVLLVLAGLLITRYATLFPFGPYASGTPFAGGRTLAKSLRQKVGTGIVHIAVSPEAEPIVNYYRTRYRQANWVTGSLDGPHDYYVLTPRDAGLIEERHLHVVYRDSGLTLAQ